MTEKAAADLEELDDAIGLLDEFARFNSMLGKHAAKVIEAAQKWRDLQAAELQVNEEHVALEERIRHANVLLRAGSPVHGAIRLDLAACVEKWLALVWKPGTEKPERSEFVTLAEYRDEDGSTYMGDAHYDEAAGGWFEGDGIPLSYLDGALPEAPRA